ncbi:class F sortase [Luteipulveratus sp. YIM 133132]|uniref:class F sortase n=1 Tax=Luteipulveratus flavus TaxID=3031728 RepID=UPI0023AF6176|nr:class F sortase [Luteipulveratus sp. YIM 133132]MDE9365408.1 class F sortase [Luteipulveratus sp. YIM 133132]
MARRRVRAYAVGLALAITLTPALTGCASGGSSGSPAAGPTSTSATTTGGAAPSPTPTPRRSLSVSVPQAAQEQSSPGAPQGSTASASAARTARPAASQRLTFVPTHIVLRGAHEATIEQADTTPAGDLDLPTRSGQVGWWRSGALAGEEFGTVVVAGHIDTPTGGVGFFADLLRSRPGDEIRLEGDGLAQRYRVTAVHDIVKASLSGRSDTFTQSGPGRLVLITCTGTFDHSTGHYDQNRLVFADPVGLATPVR